MPTKSPLQCISTQEAADLLTVKQSTIYRLVSRGELRGVKIGGRLVILERDLKAYLGVED